MVLWVFQTQFSQSDPGKKPLKKIVYVSQVVDHPALQKTLQGIKDTLLKEGLIQGIDVEIRVESAQGNGALALQIASKIYHQKPDAAVGLGTLSAQSFLKYVHDSNISWFFSSVTDPLGAGLTQDLKIPGKSRKAISGVSNFVPLEPQIALFKRIQPSMKRLGIIFNPSEVNSMFILRKLEEVCQKMDIKLIKQSIYKTTDIPQNVHGLAQKCDAIFISNDNTALSALEHIISIAKKHKIPVYVSDTDGVSKGALAALGPNQYQIGVQTGRMILKALKGDVVTEMPVVFPDNNQMYLNEDVAFELGITITDDIKNESFSRIKNGMEILKNDL
jgi:putative ABC transport system substrate-binding protein